MTPKTVLFVTRCHRVAGTVEVTGCGNGRCKRVSQLFSSDTDMVPTDTAAGSAGNKKPAVAG